MGEEQRWRGTGSMEPREQINCGSSHFGLQLGGQKLARHTDTPQQSVELLLLREKDGPNIPRA